MVNLTGSCPICDGEVTLPQDTEESEIVACGECNNQIVVKAVKGNSATLDEAPEVEEDWGQ